ncbi:hypothetical protein D9M68_817780 [compost metagenome]
MLLHLPLPVAVAHNGGGALLLLCLVLVNYRLRAPVASAAREPVAAQDSRAELAPTVLAQAGK